MCIHVVVIVQSFSTPPYPQEYDSKLFNSTHVTYSYLEKIHNNHKYSLIHSLTHSLTHS